MTASGDPVFGRSQAVAGTAASSQFRSFDTKRPSGREHNYSCRSFDPSLNLWVFEMFKPLWETLILRHIIGQLKPRELPFNPNVPQGL